MNDRYHEAIAYELGLGDQIVEQGTNQSGEYTKLYSGKIIMHGISETLPCPTLTQPEVLGERVVTGHWR